MKLKDAVRIAKQADMASARRFATHVVPEVVRPARVIWNQAIGALFLVLAIPATFKAFQLYQDRATDPKAGFGLVVSGIFAAIMLGFGIASFLKARRIASRAPRS